MAASPPKSLRLRINIGGQKIIEVQPELFCVAGDNKLSALFSGRWEPHLDASGNYFVDYSPEVFMPFVEWLREFRDTPPDQRPPCVDVDSRHRRAIVRMMTAFAIEVRYLRLAGFSVDELLSFGFDVGSCFRAGYTVRQIVHAGASLESFRKDGVPASDLKNAVDVEELRLAGYTLEELLGAGYTREQVKEAGFGVADFFRAGETVKELLDFFPVRTLVEAGITVEQLIRAGCSPRTLQGAARPLELFHGLRNMGFTSAQILEELGKLPVLTLERLLPQLMQENLAPALLRRAGCTVELLRPYRLTADRLKQAGFSASEVASAGYISCRELRQAGFSAANLVNVLSLRTLAAAGYSARALREAGFSAVDLADEGFSKDSLEEAGFSNMQFDCRADTEDLGRLRRLGYTPQHLPKECFYDLRAAGYTYRELLQERTAETMRDLFWRCIPPIVLAHFFIHS